MLAYNFFNCWCSNKSLYLKGEYTQKLSQSLIFNNNHEDLVPNKDGYVRPARGGACELPIGAKFVKKDASDPIVHRMCKIDAYYGKWDGDEFPKITTRYSKIKCMMPKFEMCTFCFCYWGKSLCVQCH